MFIWIKSEVSDFRPVFFTDVPGCGAFATGSCVSQGHAVSSAGQRSWSAARRCALVGFVMFSGDVEPMVKNWDECYLSEICIYIYVFCMVTSGNLLYITNLCRTMTISLRFRESCNVLRWYFWSSANSVFRVCSIKAHMCNHQIDICLTCHPQMWPWPYDVWCWTCPNPWSMSKVSSSILRMGIIL